MKHYRRKALLKATNELYLNNYKAANSYAEQARLMKYMELTASNLAKQFAGLPDSYVATQLNLFTK